MSDGAEILVKKTLKYISKKYDLDYSELKNKSKKIIKMAKNFDEELLGVMEELLDLGRVDSPEELADFNIEVLKIYCKIKDLDDSGSDKSIRARVWENIELEESEDEETDSDDDDSDDDSVVDSDEETEEIVLEKKPEQVVVKKEKYDPQGSADEQEIVKREKKHRHVKISEDA